jgi:hypothetical protein
MNMNVKAAQDRERLIPARRNRWRGVRMGVARYVLAGIASTMVAWSVMVGVGMVHAAFPTVPTIAYRQATAITTACLLVFSSLWILVAVVTAGRGRP